MVNGWAERCIAHVVLGKGEPEGGLAVACAASLWVSAVDEQLHTVVLRIVEGQRA